MTDPTRCGAPPEGPSCDDRLLWDTWLSALHFPVLTAADELGVFPLLSEWPASVVEIAQKLAISPRAAEALVAVLVSLGYLAQHDGRFYLTEVSANYLLPSSPFYWGVVLEKNRATQMHSLVLQALRRDQRPDRPRITDSWRVGEEEDEKRIRTFIQGMHAHFFPGACGVARHGDFRGVRRLLDVGGGSGCFCIALATRYPETTFTVMDLPIACRVARGYIADYGFHERVQVVEQNMFQSPWPAGHDAVFFSNIWHDWSLDDCAELARSSWNSLPSRGRIYIHEMLLTDTRDGPLAAALFSLQMFVKTEGKQFAAGELGRILTAAGFEDITVMPTFGYFSLVSARKP